MINNNLLIRYCCALTLFPLISLTQPVIARSSKTAFTYKSAIDSARGVVRDDNGKPLAGVLITEKRSGRTRITGEDGRFSFVAQPGETLLFDHPDFYHKEAVSTGKPMNVQLITRFLRGSTAILLKDTAANSHQGMVDILHGQQSQQTIIQSVGTAYTNQLTTTPASQLLQALPGRIAGLNIGFSSGGPALDGAGMSFNVRGARANLVLVDGVQRNFWSVDPEEIESISVLKDALSTVMYGMRSSDGIISITTKKGDRGTPRISFSSQYGIESPLGLPKPLSAGQFATLYNQAQQNDAGTTIITPKYSQADIAAYNNGTDPYGHPNVDWYKTVLNSTSALKKYNFNLQGTGTGFRYFVDLDNLSEGGLFKTSSANTYNTNDQLDRYIIRTNLGVDVTKTTFMQLNLFGRIETNNQPGGANPGGSASIFSSLATTPANAYPVLNPDGSLAGTGQYGQDVNIYGQAVSRGYVFQNLRDMAVDLQATQKLDIITPGLYLKGQGSYNNSTIYSTNRSKDFAVFQYNPTTQTYQKYGTTSAQTTVGTAGARARLVYVDGELGYDHNFSKHHVGVVALADQQSNLQFDTGNLPEYYTDYAARVNYNWDEKYLIEGAGSYAGYSWMDPSKRWSPFWAVGAGWNMHRESFIKNNFNFISNLKLRGTYGLTGQANAGYFTYIQTFWTPSSNTNNNDGYYFGTNGVSRSTGQSSLASVVGPEKAKKLNIGVDLGLWDNQLTFTGEYFKNKFFDLVGTPGIQTLLLGLPYPTENIGINNYWGEEFSLAWQSHVHNFNYFVSGNFSLVQSKIIFSDEIPRNYAYERTTGTQVGLNYGYTAIGLFQSYAEINDPKTAVLSSTPKSSLRPGDIRYLDRNGDGVINSDDQGPIGSGLPVIYYGLTTGFNYKGFDISVLFQGTMNRQSYLNGDFWNGFGNGGNNNAYAYNLNAWTPQNPSAVQPRLWVGSNTNNQQTSSFWIRNTDFVRLKNAEVGYTFPSALTRKIHIPSIRMYVNGLNLVTWSELFKLRKDVDPESLYTGSTYPYPILRTINFGLNVKF
jgi:TonB-linked SusC/RagA family outer membrane protein